MTYYSPLAYLFGMCVVFLFAALPFFKDADTAPSSEKSRLYPLDGLRGILALAVFFHHGAVYRQYLTDGKWAAPPSRFYTDIGEIGVAMFFMITGYLFWSQALKYQGKLDLKKLYIRRAFRIVPLYLLLASIVLLSVGTLTNWTLQDTPRNVFTHAAMWLAGGIVPGGIVNHYAETKRISAGVTWTLNCEWAFYISLALTAFFARTKVSGLLFPIGILLTASVASLLNQGGIFSTVAMLFSAGMTTAAAKPGRRFSFSKKEQWAISVAAMAGPVAVVLFFGDAYSAMPIFILMATFALITCGATLFGLLITKSARRLGDVSYGIYLLQGPLFFWAFSIAPVRVFAERSASTHWIVVTALAITLVSLSTLTHVFIERPGVKAGNRFVVWIGRSTAIIDRKSSRNENDQDGA